LNNDTNGDPIDTPAPRNHDKEEKEEDVALEEQEKKIADEPLDPLDMVVNFNSWTMAHMKKFYTPALTLFEHVAVRCTHSVDLFVLVSFNRVM
jgi:hypothetical protein